MPASATEAPGPTARGPHQVPHGVAPDGGLELGKGVTRLRLHRLVELLRRPQPRFRPRAWNRTALNHLAAEQWRFHTLLVAPTECVRPTHHLQRTLACVLLDARVLVPWSMISCAGTCLLLTGIECPRQHVQDCTCTYLTGCRAARAAWRPDSRGSPAGRTPFRAPCSMTATRGATMQNAMVCWR